MLAFFGMGLSQIKNSVSYVWASECVPLPQKSLSFTIINLIDALPMAVLCLYFLFISKDWYYINFYVTLTGYVALMFAFICPESPRWLLVNGKSKEAIKVLNYMSKFNGNLERIPNNTQFVEDPTVYFGDGGSTANFSP